MAPVQHLGYTQETARGESPPKRPDRGESPPERPDRGESPPERPDRAESPAERLDRNTTEMVAELRVAGTGIQVLFAFLLIVPFNTGFRHVSSFDRDVYFVSLICVAAAATLLIAPTIHHRLLFRRAQKAYLLRLGTRLAVAAMLFLSIGLTGIMILLANVVFGTAAAAVVGTVAAAGLGAVWFGLPLTRRKACPPVDPV